MIPGPSTASKYGNSGSHIYSVVMTVVTRYVRKRCESAIKSFITKQIQ